MINTPLLFAMSTTTPFKLSSSIYKRKAPRVKRTTIKLVDDENSTTPNSLAFVVHCRRAKYDVYIGRFNPCVTGGRNPEWGNRFVIGSDGDRNEVIHKYEEWITAQPELIAKAKRELRGKVLGCWCAPQACHGHVLARIANEDENESTGAQ